MSGTNGAYSLISHDDYLQVVRLAAEVAAAERPCARRRVLASGAIELAGAQFAVIGLATTRGASLDFCPATVQTLGWDDPSAVQRTLSTSQYKANPMIEPALRRLSDRPWAVADREEFFTDRQWQALPFVQTVNRQLDVGPSLYAGCRILGKSQALCLGVFRRWNDRRRFAERDTQRVSLLMEFAHRAAPAFQGDQDPAAGLAPRLRQTLRGLLAGQSEKEIARELGIRRGTVHLYVTALYRHFDVHSVRELMAILRRPIAAEDLPC